MRNLLTTDEGHAVYDRLSAILKEAGGAVARARSMGAYLLASHAETYATAMRLNGRPGYTALDYIKENFSLRIEELEKREDTRYFKAIERGDMDTVRRMVIEKAEANGFTDAIPEQTAAYRVRPSGSPKITRKVYKVFTLAPDGAPSALFIAGTEKLPMGVWLDAVDSWHFIAENGHKYVPSTLNPWTESRHKTGKTVPIPDDVCKEELVQRGFVTEKATNVTALAYRPGWHAGSMPFFPQGGVKSDDAPYGMKHRYNQVVFECEVAAEKDYTRCHEIIKDGSEPKIAYDDMQEMPTNGMYRYATNPLTKANEGLGEWIISSSLKINRALTQEECDEILIEHGLLPQEWEQGKLNLADLGYTGEDMQTCRKTLAPITYDEKGNIIPLSKRFNVKDSNILYQIATTDKNPTAEDDLELGRMSIGANGRRVITLFENADETTLVHEIGHTFLMDLEKISETGDRQANTDLKVINDWASWHEGACREYAGSPWEAEFYNREKEILEAHNSGNIERESLLKYEWKHERFSRGFELYVANGKAPSHMLKNVFKKFSGFIRKVYSRFHLDGGRANPDVEAAMGRMIFREKNQLLREKVWDMALACKKQKDIVKGIQDVMPEVKVNDIKHILNEVLKDIKKKGKSKNREGLVR